jgi:hypothetical protein
LLRNAFKVNRVVCDVIANIAVATSRSVLQLGFVIQQIDGQPVQLLFQLSMSRITQRSDPIGQLFLIVDVTEAEHGRQVLDFLEAAIRDGPDLVQRREGIVSFPFQLPQLCFEGGVHVVFDV